MDRRSFLSFVSLALAATATSCRRPAKQIVPAHTPAEYSAVGDDVYFSTVIPLSRTAYPVRVRTRDFKPIAIVPNEKAKGLASAPSAAAIASLFNLYDPLRFRRPSVDSSETDLDKALDELFSRFESSNRTWIFYREKNSPTLLRLLDLIKTESAGKIDFAPLCHPSELRPYYDNDRTPRLRRRTEWNLAEAETIVVLSSDPNTNPAKLLPQIGKRAKLVVIESAVSPIGQLAETRIETPSGEVAAYARELERDCSIILSVDAYHPDRNKPNHALAKELCHKEKVAFVASANDSALSEIAFSLNNLFATMGHGVGFIADSQETIDIDQVRIAAGDCVLFSECNPDEFFFGNGNQLSMSVPPANIFYHTLYKPSRAASHSIDIPATHYAEHWADTQIFGYGTAIGQPVIEPLNNQSISLGDILIRWLAFKVPTKYSQFTNYYDYLRSQYSQLDRQAWQSVLQVGLAENSIQYQTQPCPMYPPSSRQPGTLPIWRAEYSSDSFDSVYFSQNPFLEELEYSNPVELIGPKSANELRRGAFSPSKLPAVAGKGVGTQWAMAIDLGKCDGCRNCVLSCGFENNVPNAGREENQRGRAMQWIRIEKYSLATAENEARALFVPIMCQHCSHAPCESVCPASAVSHSPEGLNETTYNRCVGSRICMANCPYKVRRFNYTDHSKDALTPLDNMLNPSVTVRSRGVVEKCSFCVQRINRARTKANVYTGGMIPDGEVIPACAESCPHGAITFGNICNPESAIFKLLSTQPSFNLLGASGTLPNVFYIIV